METLTAVGAARTEIALPWCLSEAHLAWQSTVRKFCNQAVAPAAGERSLRGNLDPELLRGLGELGVYGLLVPEDEGGSGADLVSLCVAVEELARVDSSLAVTAHVQAISVALFHHLASPEQRAEIMPRLASGEFFVSFGLTEPHGGSDAGNIVTRAEREGDGWRLNGAKEFITNSGTPFSRYLLTFAATGDGAVRRPLVSAFLIPLDAEGVDVGASYPKLGWRASDTHPIHLQDVHLPAAALLGEEGRGYREALRFLTWARIPIAAMSAGLARACVEETLAHVSERSSFGQPLSSFQGVAFQIAEMSAMASTARLLTYDAAWKYDRGLSVEQEAATAKLVASELANKVAYTATQLHGGMGFMDDTPVARHYRDARILTIGEGTSEIQKLLIARYLGLPL